MKVEEGLRLALEAIQIEEEIAEEARLKSEDHRQRSRQKRRRDFLRN